MKKRIKLKRIQDEMKEVQKKNADIRKEKIKKRNELIILAIFFLLIVLYFFLTNNTEIPLLKKLGDFGIFNILFFLIVKEIYTNIKTREKAFKNNFIILIVSSVFIYLSSLIYLFMLN